ncbi:HNH endonuclease [Flavobacterium sp. JP2137]|uniref:HNH endonuclease signature motif containing protein n=1 Tax=Flavobacterium sp. JP2137 TaxID=3414510 RepID=UPI003D2FE042
MGTYRNISREIWQQMRVNTPFQQPEPDTGPYQTDFYGNKRGEGIDFKQLVHFLYEAYLDSSLVFNWRDYKAPTVMDIYRIADREGGYTERAQEINPAIAFAYLNERKELVQTVLEGKLNKRVDYLEDSWAFLLRIEPQNKYALATLCFYYDDTAQFRTRVGDLLESSTFQIEEKYIAIQLSSQNLNDFYGLVQTVISEAGTRSVQLEIGRRFTRLLGSASKASELKFLYESAPSFCMDYLRDNLDSRLITAHLEVLKSYDDRGWFSLFRDSSGALINLMKILGDSRLLYSLFWNNPVLVKELYRNMDGYSKVGGNAQKNSSLFVDLLWMLCLSHSFDGSDRALSSFRIGKNYRVMSDYFALSEQKKDQIYLQQRMGRPEKKLEKYPDDIPRLSQGREVDTVVFSAEDLGSYFHPLQAVLLIDMDATQPVTYRVPALYLKAIADEATHKDLMTGLRIGFDLLAVILGVTNLGASSSLYIALAVADMALATTDIAVAIKEDELMKTQEGREFLDNWTAICIVGGVITAGPLLVGQTFTSGVRLLGKAQVATTQNFLRASLLKMVVELNISNFTKDSLKIIESGYEVYRESKSVIQLLEFTRLQEAGVLFVKGEMTNTKVQKYGLIVVYKGEIIASGDARVVRRSLGEVWTAKGAKLIVALEGRLVFKKIDEAIVSLRIRIRIPKNVLNVFESEREIRLAMYTLKNKIPRKGFNPSKKKLKELGVKLPKSINGLSVDFEGTAYLSPVTANQKNIVKIKMTGSRRMDNKLANKLAGFDKQPENYTWHHLDDYDPMTNTCTMQLVHSDIHTKCYPHYGAVEIVRQYFSNKTLYK